MQIERQSVLLLTLFCLYYFQGVRQENLVLNKISKHWISVSSRCRKGRRRMTSVHQLPPIRSLDIEHLKSLA